MLAQPYVPSDVTVAPSSVGLSSTSVVPAPSGNVVASMPVATIGADTRPTYVNLGTLVPSAPPIVDTKVVPPVGVGRQLVHLLLLPRYQQ